MRHSHTVQRRRTIQRSLRRLKHRIKRLATSYVSPLGWAVTALAVDSLVAFVLLGWHELLAMAVVFAVMLAAAVMLSLGNTSFQATIDVSSRRVTVSSGLYLTGFIDYICLSVNGDFLVLHSFFRTHKASVLVETSVLHARESVASRSDTA